MTQDQKNLEDENSFLRDKVRISERQAKDRNATERLLIFGAIGLGAYLLLGMGFVAGCVGFAIFAAGPTLWESFK